MHEMSLAESVRSIVEDTARTQDIGRVRKVVLEIGELASVELDALRFCLDVVLRETVADGARIEVERIAGSGWCMRCADTVPIATLIAACPHCGGYQIRPTAGTQMRVKELEVE
jgi:hydrogenase nickel incorporation protein HypA/HybF